MLAAAGAGLFAGGVGVGYVLHHVPTVAKPVAPAPVASPSSDVDQSILKAMDQKGLLQANGKAIDAFGAINLLDAGKPIQVAVPGLAYHPAATIEDDKAQLNADQVKAQQEKINNGQYVTVHGYDELEKLNAAEKLTDVDSSAALSDSEQTMLSQLKPLEGTAPPAHVEKSATVGGAAWAYVLDNPAPGLINFNHHRHFAPTDRLSAFEAMEQLEHGKPVVVTSPGGLPQVVRQAEQLGPLVHIELAGTPSSQIGLKASAESDVQAALLHDIAANRQFTAVNAAPDIAAGQTLTGYQASQLIAAGQPVKVAVGPGLSVTLNSLKDLEILNAEEGLTKVDTSTLLSDRQQKTVSELRLFEKPAAQPAAPATTPAAPATPDPNAGSGTNSTPATPDPNAGSGSGTATPGAPAAPTDHSAILSMKKAWLTGKPVASSHHLTVHEARASLEGGQAVAVRTAQGQVHVIHNVNELDVLAKVYNPPPPPPAPAPATPATPPATQPTPDPNATQPATPPATQPTPDPNATPPATQPTPDPNATQPATPPATQPTPDPNATQPATPPATQPTPDPNATQPATPPATQPTPDPSATQPATPPATQPTPDPSATQPATPPATQPTPDPNATQPTTPPATQPTPDPNATQPTTPPATQPTTPATTPSTPPTPDPNATQPTKSPATQPTPDPNAAQPTTPATTPSTPASGQQTPAAMQPTTPAMTPSTPGSGQQTPAATQPTTPATTPSTPGSGQQTPTATQPTTPATTPSTPGSGQQTPAGTQPNPKTPPSTQQSTPPKPGGGGSASTDSPEAPVGLGWG
jgi:hypothetical protein